MNITLMCLKLALYKEGEIIDRVIREFLSLFTERVSPSGSSNEIRNHPPRIRMSRENNRDQLPPGQPPPGPGKFELMFLSH